MKPVRELRAELITSFDALEQLRPQWQALWEDCACATPFQSPGWLMAWWRHFGTGDLHVLALRDGAELAVLVPCYLRGSPDGVARELSLIGTGLSDYLDALVRAGYEPGVELRISEELDRTREHWDVCDFEELRPDSPLLYVDCASAVSETSVCGTCPSLRLPAAVEEPGSMPIGAWRRYRRYRRRSQNAGLSLEMPSGEAFDRAFSEFLELHTARWRARGMDGVVADPPVANFHREVAREFRRLGLLRFYTLSVAGRAIAALYCFSCRRRTFAYLSGLDPEYAHFSPGTVLLGHAIDQAVCEGTLVFDFLRGDEPYKYSWGARNGFTYRRRLFKPASCRAAWPVVNDRAAGSAVSELGCPLKRQP